MNTKIESLLLQNLEKHINHISPNHKIKEAYLYATLPAGKLFRPKMACAMYQDCVSGNLEKELLNENSNLSLIASAIEIHHAYTLIHDDLPCMDDDDIRRGRPSVHKAFNEHTAVLAGDALLIASFQLLSKVKSTYPHINLFARSTGAKGLIHGQVLDLDQKTVPSLSQIRDIHYLKTGKLIQMSLLLPLISYKTIDLKKFMKILKLGKNIGILFQFLDDLTEVVEDQVKNHEFEINPWEKYHSQLNQECENRINSSLKILEEYEEIGLSFRSYLAKISTICAKRPVREELKPIVSFLNRF